MNSYNFFKKCPYNQETREHLWCSVITDSHDSLCGCTSPISHWLSIVFPEGHKDLDLTVRQIIQRESENQRCLFGGGKEDKDGTAAEIDAFINQEKEEDILPPGENIEDNLEELLAAAEEAEKR